jgi:hypothetical protein
MRADSTVKILLLIIAILLGVIALRPLFAPPAAQTQGGDVYPFFIEPGYTTLRARRRQPPSPRQNGRRPAQRRHLRLSYPDRVALSG